MKAIRWWIRGVAAAALVAASVPVWAQGTLDGETMKRYGGTYLSDCGNPASPRVTVFAEALVFVQTHRSAGTMAEFQGLLWGLEQDGPACDRVAAPRMDVKHGNQT